MDCLRNTKGKRMCDLVKLPNTTKEFMCTECKNQFIKKGEGSDFDGVWILLILSLLLFVFLLAGCSKQSTKLLLIRIADSSASALNDPKQAKGSLTDARWTSLNLREIKKNYQPHHQNNLRIDIQHNLLNYHSDIPKKQRGDGEIGVHQKPKLSNPLDLPQALREDG